jgi:methionyl-tRNA formyltransferase
MGNLRVFISGQQYFGESVLAMCLEKGVQVVGVCCPVDDKYIRRLAIINEIPVINSGFLSYDTMPKNVALGITAHSFDYIGKKTRYSTRLGWIGYHPSLLPRHRGKSSIEWAVRMGDAITGGTVFWLNSGIDRGDIAYQDWCFISPEMFSISPKKAAKIIWRESLQDMGLKLISKALDDIQSGIIIRKPQEQKFSTWEPDTAVKDIYRPDSLMIPQKTGISGWIKQKK